MLVLAGDIGGTHTRLALYTKSKDRFECTLVGRFRSRDFEGLEGIVQRFLEDDSQRVSAACFGVPGPVFDGSVSTTNLPWKMSERVLSHQLGIEKVRLVNDLAALAATLPFLDSTEVEVLHAGSPPQDKTVYSVSAPGTGLGQAMVQMIAGKPYIVGSEGGHINFGPRNELEIELLRYLILKYKRVSFERLLSGPGIFNLYSFLRDTGVATESPEIGEKIKSGDPSRTISEAGITGEDQLCIKTLELFASILGSHAGNVMLTYMSTGGVFLGGGIVPKIAPFLRHPDVIEAYMVKGRLSPMIEATPLFLIKDDRSGLHGAARLAALL